MVKWNYNLYGPTLFCTVDVSNKNFPPKWIGKSDHNHWIISNRIINSKNFILLYGIKQRLFSALSSFFLHITIVRK